VCVFSYDLEEVVLRHHGRIPELLESVPGPTTLETVYELVREHVLLLKRRVVVNVDVAQRDGLDSLAVDRDDGTEGGGAVNCQGRGDRGLTGRQDGGFYITCEWE